MKNINFSIIICCYNEEKNIEELFLSLNNIIYNTNKYEIIIIDDGSTDETIKSIKHYSKIFNSNINIRFYNINHSGLSVARNTGYYLSKYNYCLFCDADAIIDRFILKAYEKKIILKNDYIYAGRVVNLNFLDPISNLIYNLHNEPSLTLSKNKLIGANMLLNKELLNTQFPFFNYFKARGDETAMFISICQKYDINTTNYVKDALVKNETSNTLKDWFNKMYIEGINNKIIENFFQKNLIKYLINSVIKINTAFLVFLIMIIFFLKINLIFFFSLFIFILRLIPRKQYLIRGLKNVYILNPFFTILSFLISIFGIIVSDIGYSTAFLRNKKMNNRKTKASKIKKILII